MTTPAERRIRRPKEMEGLINDLLKEGAFATIREILVFAAAVGYQREVRAPFTEVSEPVRWDTMIKSPYFEALVDMLSAADSTVRPELLGESHLDERLKVFEEYANGGLGVLSKEIRSGYGDSGEIVNAMVDAALRGQTDGDDPSVSKLADDLVW